MAAFQKFQSFVEALAEKKHDLGADTLRVLLSNTAPNAATANGKADLVEIAAGNGYAAGGPAIVVTGSAQAGGTYKLTANDLVITAAGGPIGPFRYAAIYNDTSVGDLLIAFVDYGAAITLLDGETLTLDFDGANGVLQIA